MANPPVAADTISTLSNRHRGNKPNSASLSAHSATFDSDSPKEQLAHFNMRRFRPMGVADMFDEAFDLYKHNFKLMLVATAIVYIPLYVILIAFFNPLTTQLEQLTTSASPDFDRLLDLAGKTMVDSSIATMVYAFATIITTGAVGYVVGQRYLGRDVSIGEAYLLAGRKIFVLCFSVILAGLFGSLWLLGCGLLVLVPACRFSILPQVVMLEKQGIVRAVKRCWKMTSPAAWRLGTVLTMLFVVDLIMRDALTEPLGLVQQYLAEHVFPVMSTWNTSETVLATSIIGCLVGLLLQPLGIAVMTVAYYDIRIREEGFDMAIINELLDHGSSDAVEGLPEIKSPRGRVVAKKR